MGFSAAVIEYVYCTIYTHDFPVKKPEFSGFFTLGRTWICELESVSADFSDLDLKIGYRLLFHWKTLKNQMIRQKRFSALLSRPTLSASTISAALDYDLQLVNPRFLVVKEEDDP